MFKIGFDNKFENNFSEMVNGLRRTRAALSHFAPFLKPRKKGLLLALVLLLLETGTSLAQPWPLALILDYVLGTETLPGFAAVGTQTLLIGIVVLLVVISTASRAITAFRRYLLSKLGQETVFDMRDALYRKVHDLGLDYHGARRTGDTITRVTSDVKEVRSLLVDSVVEVGSSFLILIGMLFVMLWMSPSLTVLALVTVPFLFLAVRRYRQALIERMRVVRAKEGAIASVIQEAVTGIRAVKIFAREKDELDRFRKESRDSLSASVDSSAIEAKFGVLLGIVGGAGTALVVYFAALQVLAGTISVGELTVFVSYLGLFLSPLWALSRQVNQIGKSLVSGERIIELLSAEPTVKDSPDARPAPRLSGRVAFEDVHFTYEDEAGEVLRGMDFEVEAGSRVALVGMSGAGKTTVTSLLARLYDPQDGRVLVDDEDVKEYTLKSLRDQITFVPQEPMLFRATVAENISYGKPGAVDAGDRRSRPSRRRGRLHPRDARRLRDASLRARGELIRRTAPAHLHRAGDAAGYPYPDPRRAPDGPRRRSRRGRRGELANPHRGPYHLRHRPRAEVGEERGQDPGPPGWPGRRERNPRRVDLFRRPLRPPLHPSGTGPRPRTLRSKTLRELMILSVVLTIVVVAIYISFS